MPNVETFITSNYTIVTTIGFDGKQAPPELEGKDATAVRELSASAGDEERKKALGALADYMAKREANGYYVTVKNRELTYTDKTMMQHNLNLSTVTDFAFNVGKEAAQLQDQRFLAEYQAQVEQLQALKDINTALEAVNTAKAGDKKLSTETWALLKKLADAKKITLDTDWKKDSMTAEQLDTLRSNLTTAQSSQSATNEEASMRLNEAANARSAIFTQLHTLLQTLMQATQAVARW